MGSLQVLSFHLRVDQGVTFNEGVLFTLQSFKTEALPQNVALSATQDTHHQMFACFLGFMANQPLQVI